MTDTTRFHPETPEPVRKALELARNNSARVRIYCGDVKTGRAWQEEWGTCGTIGRSMGPVKVPLLIPNRRSTGGPALLDHCIVAIMTRPGVFLYKHPSFSTGEWSVQHSDLADYAANVLNDGKVYGRCKTMAQAFRLRDFMRGDRLSK